MNNFFATFMRVFLTMMRSLLKQSLEVELGVTSSDYLDAYLSGTRNVLYENGRESVAFTIDKLDEQSLGEFIALYERAVGFYATLVNVNAYHQPGVDAEKNMTGAVIKLQHDDVLIFY